MAGPRAGGGRHVLHQQPVADARRDQACIPADGREPQRGDHADHCRDQRGGIDPAIGAVVVVKMLQVQRLAANHIVVDDQDREDRPQEGAVGLDEDPQSRRGFVAHQQPGKSCEGQKAHDDGGCLEGQLEDVHHRIGRRHHVVEDVRRHLRKGDEQQRDDQQDLVVHGTGEDADRVDLSGRAGHHQPDQAHEQRRRQDRVRIDRDLLARPDLMLQFARIVRHVQHHRRIDAEEQHRRAPERRTPGALGLQQVGADRLAIAADHAEEHVDQRTDDEDGTDVLQPLDAVEAQHRQADLQKLEADEEHPDIGIAEHRLADEVQGASADPALEAVPDDGGNRPHQRRQARAAEAIGGPRLHHEGDAVFVPRTTVDHQRHADDRAANGNGQHRLQQVQRADQARSDREGADADAAAQPSEQIGPGVHDPYLLRGKRFLAHLLVVGGPCRPRRKAGRCLREGHVRLPV